MHSSIVKSDKMKREMTLFHTMGPKRNVLSQRHLLFVTKYGIAWRFSVKLLTKDDAGRFESPPLQCTPLYLVMIKHRGWHGFAY